MESAIPDALKCPRTRSRRIPDDYTPPFPAWVARAEPNDQPQNPQATIGYFGVQYRGAALGQTGWTALQSIVQSFQEADGPGHHDLAHYVDAAGYDNLIAIAYWTCAQAFGRWTSCAPVEAWWSAPERLSEGLGYFREIVSPKTEAFETLFSAPDRREGIGVAMGARSREDIQEHGYWGSMRDRLPCSQTDALEPAGELVIAAGAPGLGRRVRLRGHKNVAVIRSGQDWTDTAQAERVLYLEQMEPVLRAGMAFLQDHGRTIGCYTNRYMRSVDAAGSPIEKTFGYSSWRSLGHMEAWSESHPTHVAIFGTFMQMVQALNFQLQLRLYHEVVVVDAGEQDYEYINCHPGTGLLNGL